MPISYEPNYHVQIAELMRRAMAGDPEMQMEQMRAAEAKRISGIQERRMDILQRMQDMEPGSPEHTKSAYEYTALGDLATPRQVMGSDTLSAMLASTGVPRDIAMGVSTKVGAAKEAKEGKIGAAEATGRATVSQKKIEADYRKEIVKMGIDAKAPYWNSVVNRNASLAAEADAKAEMIRRSPPTGASALYTGYLSLSKQFSGAAMKYRMFAAATKDPTQAKTFNTMAENAEKSAKEYLKMVPSAAQVPSPQ